MRRLLTGEEIGGERDESEIEDGEIDGEEAEGGELAPVARDAADDEPPPEPKKRRRRSRRATGGNAVAPPVVIPALPPRSPLGELLDRMHAEENAKTHPNELYQRIREEFPIKDYRYGKVACPLCEPDGAYLGGKLTITPLEDGRIEVYCFGCEYKEVGIAAIVAALPLPEETRDQLAAVAVPRPQRVFPPRPEPEPEPTPLQSAMLSVGMVTAAAILDRPDPAWLVEGLLQTGSFGALVGPPESYKSFMALGLALAVAAGRPWAGRAVQQGAVVYLAAEGAAGLKARLRANLGEGDRLEDLPLHMITREIDLTERHAGGLYHALREAVESLRPALLIIDTLAQTMGGGNENAASSMGDYIMACNALRRASGGALLVIHHTGKDEDGPRGSSALSAALDTLAIVHRRDRRAIIQCGKMKDAPRFDPFTLQSRVVEFEGGSSLALELVEGEIATARNRLTPTERRALGAIEEIGMPLTFTEWHATAGGDKRVFARAIKALTGCHVRKEGEGRGATYHLVTGDNLVTLGDTSPTPN